MNKKKSDLIASIMWLALGMAWVVLLFIDFKRGTPEGQMIMHAICAVSSIIVGAANYRKYKA
ncbi:MAG: hypothetical protein IKU80_02495 [Firmicutes bacterium]|nr:hypothetical protein [Bacillota bacterium]